VYGIVKQSRGYIDVASDLGQGTRFAVYLPRVGGPETEAPTPEKAIIPTASRDTILVVEDEDSIRRLIATILQDHGYRVMVATDGVEALQTLESMKERCDLVITDVMMPRITSSVFVEELRALRPQTHILYMSGYARETLQANGVEDDAPFLQKPFLPNTLLEKVHELLQTHSTR
jgi:CheY-like chemotaxis protein